MTNRLRRVFLTAGLLLAAWATLAPAIAEQPAPLPVGYLELNDDPRYAARKAYARIGLQSRMRPYPGAELGIKDTAMIASVAGTRLALDRITGDDGTALVGAIKQALTDRGIHYFLMDLPEAIARAVTAGTQGMDVLLFNISEGSNALRGTECARQMIHIYPSLRMKTDALSQYLRIRAWGKVLLLTGPDPADIAYADSFRASAERYSLRLVEDRPFELSNDPRQRGKNNVALLTATSRDYDIIVLADRSGEFARYVPFATNRPRPIMGGTGLDANAWHWAFERFGAPQLNSRFLRANNNRHMSDADWAAWVAIKAIVHARVRSNSREFEVLSAYLRGQTMKIDGFKGVALNLRPWNNQLRQPILLATHDAVISTAPVEGFLHQVNDLDTLGIDEKENTCSFE
jgi:ABC transporter substrate binding protein (PQQ-dependent alcohol dehydrogenase system)